MYVLAPNKTKKTYQQVFNWVSKQVPEWKPMHIMSDFELGAINAAKEVFPEAKMHGCFVHFCQAIWRRVQLVGLQTKYSNDPVFALNIRQLISLAFLPSENIADAFSMVCRSEFWTENENDENSPKIQEILDYFETNFIGIDTRTQSKRRRASFASSTWSVYELTLLGMT